MGQDKDGWRADDGVLSDGGGKRGARIPRAAILSANML